MSPDDLARRLASQLASKKPPKPRYRLRDSVFVGRLIAGAAALAIGAAILAAVMLGVDWWTGRSTAAEVLTSQIDTIENGTSTTTIPGAGEPSGIHVVQPFLPLSNGSSIGTGFLPQLPSPTSTSPSGPAGSPTTGRTSPSASSPTPPTAGAPTTPPTSPTTSLATTSTSVGATTSTVQTTTTTLAGTTTTIPPTTTTVAATTTTCVGNSGSGQGTGPCGP